METGIRNNEIVCGRGGLPRALGRGTESLDLGALSSVLSAGTWPWGPITLAG